MIYRIIITLSLLFLGLESAYAQVTVIEKPWQRSEGLPDLQKLEPQYHRSSDAPIKFINIPQLQAPAPNQMMRVSVLGLDDKIWSVIGANNSPEHYFVAKHSEITKAVLRHYTLPQSGSPAAYTVQFYKGSVRRPATTLISGDTVRVYDKSGKQIRIGIVSSASAAQVFFLLFDLSGSMSGNESLLQKTAAFFATQTPSGSYCALSGFTNDMKVISHLDICGSQSLKQGADRIVTRGGTNILKSLLSTYQYIKSPFAKYKLNRRNLKSLIVVTDGVGSSPSTTLAQLVSAKNAQTYVLSLASPLNLPGVIDHQIVAQSPSVQDQSQAARQLELLLQNYLKGLGTAIGDSFYVELAKP